MSPQSALSVKATKETKYINNMYSDCSNLSNSQIAQAADEAFSHHKRLDLGYTNDSNDSGDGYNHLTAANPLGSKSNSYSNHRLQLRKRKKSFESARFLDQAVTDYSTDFVSGIFRDLSQAEEDPEHSDHTSSFNDIHQNNNTSTKNHENYSATLSQPLGNFRNEMNCISDDESSLARKRQKTSGNSLSTFRNFSSLGRNKKSFCCLQSITGAKGSGSGNADNVFSATAPSSTSDTCTSNQDPVSYEVSPVSRLSLKNKDHQNHQSFLTASSDATPDTDMINSLVDKVLIESLAFPNLPPTVSESSCSSNNLTQTAVQAAQVLETILHRDQSQGCHTHIEGVMHDSKDTYGWFVDMDLEQDVDRANAISAAQESVRAGARGDEDLSFQAFTAPKKTDLDEEVEWAKAADTVDDVLGDFF
mmetsp:Transcript_10823/g.13696  ORF Transcript_10823/g.13696 Transcript_10823/m.13696 type:complete len:419 (+) Transcript_10823:88-1344(+)